MNDEILKAAVGRFLANINGTAHREIEKAMRNAVASGKLKGHESPAAAVTLASETLGLNITIYSKIEF